MNTGNTFSRTTARLIVLIFLIVYQEQALAQKGDGNHHFTEVDPKPFADAAHHWYDLHDKTNVIDPLPNQPKYKTNELEKIGDNILLYQKDNGGWPKNYDIFAIVSKEQFELLLKAKSILNTTFDNGTTYTHVEALSKIYTETHKEKYKQAALKGLDFILSAQYDNGGWPQYFPLENNYSRHITYNDGAFEGIMEVVKDIVNRKPQYLFVDNKHLEKLNAAYNRGLDCILKTQINDNGKLTAWCQQHDEVTLQPAWARKFEPPSICNGESSDIVLFLMSIDNPPKDIINAIQNAVVWFDESKILHTRVKTIDAPLLNTPFKTTTKDKVVIDDPSAPPIWTRYYELKTHRPLFCNRDSKVVYSLSEVDRERRDGYSWYTYAPQKVLDHYHTWQQKWAKGNDVLKHF